MASRDQKTDADVPQGSRLWLFRLAAMTLVPLLVLLTAELGLRLAGFGHETAFLIPPRGREGVRISNPRFGWRFFPRHLARSPVPLEISETQDAGEHYRIFVVGGSAARGTPDSAYSFGRILKVLLGESYPGVRFEVLNAAMTAINSHVVLPIVRDCARYDPDLFVIYLGNNEVVGPYGAATVFQGFSPSLTAIRASVALRATHLGQLFAKTLTHERDNEGEWRGMEMFLEQKVAHDDPRLLKVYRHLERNLSAIAAAAGRAGARLLLVTVATNLRHPPFASLERPASGADGQRRRGLVETGLAAAAAGRHEAAVDSLDAAVELDPSHAGLRFHLGRSLLATGRWPEARQQLLRARDLDALRFRADSRINDVIRQVAARQAGHGVVLLDAERAFAAASEGGVPGEELFYEHVHLNFAGNDLLARQVFRGLSEVLPSRIARHAAARASLPSPDAVAERLALTPFDRHDLESSILQIISRPPFTGQSGHDDRIAGARQRLAEQRRTLTAEAWQAADQLYRRRLEHDPEDLEMRRRYAAGLARRGHFDAAVEQWRRLNERIPGVMAWRSSWALALADAGRVDEALAELQALLRRWPEEAAGIHTNLGTVLEKQERTEEAIAYYRRALAIRPRHALASYNLATAYLRLGQLERAVALYRELIAERPDLASAHHNLGRALERRGELEPAVRSYRRAVAAQPGRAASRNSLALALEAMGRVGEALEEYRTAVAYEPDYALAHFNLADLLLSQGRAAEAAAHYQQGLEWRPDNVQARYNLAGAWMTRGEDARAAAELQRVLAERGDDVGALNNLAWILATAADPELRDAPRAVELAERAARATGHRTPDVLDTLATAYEAAGRAGEAVEAWESALELAHAAGRADLAASLAERLRKRKL